MVPVPLSRLQPSRIDAIEDWPWLDQDVLRSSRTQGLDGRHGEATGLGA